MNVCVRRGGGSGEREGMYIYMVIHFHLCLLAEQQRDGIAQDSESREKATGERVPEGAEVHGATPAQWQQAGHPQHPQLCRLQHAQNYRSV